MAAYYNEIDAYAAEWLRNLIKAGHIADGEVDTRSIVDVQPDELREFTQCHFFAGIAGWSHALRLAGWQDDRQIWTGSCPCQPFSVAGQGKGVNDERHLWPHFFRLIRGCRPSVVMGEQVAGAAGYGWLDGVRSDLESESYAIEAVDTPACSVNAPHIRQRLYWVAKNMANPDMRVAKQYAGDGWKPGQTPGSRPYFEPSRRGELVSVYLEHPDGSRQSEHGGAFAVRAQQSGVECAGSDTHDMAITNIYGYDGTRRNETVQGSDGENDGVSIGSSSDVCSQLENAKHQGCDAERLCGYGEAGQSMGEGKASSIVRSGEDGAQDMANAESIGRGRWTDNKDGWWRQLASSNSCKGSNMADANGEQLRGGHAGELVSASSSNEREAQQREWLRSDFGADGNSFWHDAIWLNGADGKTRRAQPDICLLAHGVPARVGKLRAYGNAIVPPLAAEVIKAFMETL